MVAARAVWLSEFWLLPYLLLWLWIAVISVLLLVRARRAQGAGLIASLGRRLLTPRRDRSTPS
jgi:hypothetical protein